jgi:hypothetical protein
MRRRRCAKKIAVFGAKKKLRREQTDLQRPGQKMPLTAGQKHKVDTLLSIVKDALECEHKRKCDEMDAVVKKFKAAPAFDLPEAPAFDLPEARNVMKCFAAIVGVKVVEGAVASIKASNLSNAFSASASASASSASSSRTTAPSSSDATDDAEVLCLGERTAEQKNAEGFANAITLDEDDEDKLVNVRVLPPKGM